MCGTDSLLDEKGELVNTVELVGSPRKGGNTDLLSDAVPTGANVNGHVVQKVYLGDVEIGPCVDCRACKREPFACVLNDGMRELYPRLEAVPGVSPGSDLYSLDSPLSPRGRIFIL